jgi:hypothetical protein
MNRMEWTAFSDDVDPADAAASAGYGRLSAAVDAALEEAAFVSDAAAAPAPPPLVGAGPASVMDAGARAVIAAARAQRLAGAVVGDAWPTALWAAAEAQQAAQAAAACVVVLADSAGALARPRRRIVAALRLAAARPTPWRARRAAALAARAARAALDAAARPLPRADAPGAGEAAARAHAAAIHAAAWATQAARAPSPADRRCAAWQATAAAVAATLYAASAARRARLLY